MKQIVVLTTAIFMFSCSASYQSKNTWVGHDVSEALNSLGINNFKKYDLDNGYKRYRNMNKIGVIEFITRNNGVIISYLTEDENGAVRRVSGSLPKQKDSPNYGTNSSWVGQNFFEAKKSLGIQPIRKYNLENGNKRYVTTDIIGAKEFLTDHNDVIISYVVADENGNLKTISQ